MFIFRSQTNPKQGFLLTGHMWTKPFVSRLQNLLGPDYSLGIEINPVDHSAHLTSYLMDFAPLNGDWTSWRKNEDDLFYQLKKAVQTPLSGPEQIIVIPQSNGDPFFEQHFVPFMKQLAREDNLKVIDLSNSTDPAKDLYLQLATFQRNPGAWKLISATSEQTDEGPANNAIDNNPETYWHTRYDPNPTKVPHELIIDLGKTQSLNGFSYLARQDGGVNGRVKDFEIYVSDDQTNWDDPALKGTLQNSMNEQRLLFPKTTTGRYLKFKALTEVNGNVWTSIAELGILPTGKPK